MARAALPFVPIAVLVTVAGAAVVGRLGRSTPTDTASGPLAVTSSSSPAASSGLEAPLRAPTDADATAASVVAVAEAGVAAEAGLARDALGPRMVHGNARHLHRSAAAGPHAIKVGWRVNVGSAVAAQVTVSPDERTLYVATLGGSLLALDRAEGTIRWTAALGDRVYSTPLVHEDGTIYVGCDGKKLVALSPAGAVTWKLEVDGEADSGPVFGNDGTILFAAGSFVHSVRRGGDLAWRYAAKGKVFTSPAVTREGLVIVGSQDHHVHAIGAGGIFSWATDLGADVDGAAVIGDDGAVYVGTDKAEIVRLDGHGKITWRTPVGGYVRGVLSLAENGDVLAGTYGPVPRVARLAPNGVIRGAFPIKGTGAKEFGIHGGPLEDAEGTLFFGAQDDAAYAIDTHGAVRWRFETGADVDAPLTILSDGSLVIPSEDGTIAMLLP